MLKLGKKKAGEIVGLDIEAGSIAAAEVRVNGSAQIAGAGTVPLAPGVFREGEVADAAALADALKALFSEHKLSKQVRLGVGNQRVVVRTVRLPAIEDPKEMEAAVRFQAQEQMPMPLDDAVLEHQVVGGLPAEEGSTPQVDVVVVAARRDMVASFLEPIRRAGLEPAGVDLSAFGMIRALAGEQAAKPATAGENVASAEESGEPGPAGTPDSGAVAYCNIGDVMNLAVARGRSCLFTRVSTAGLEVIAGRLAAERGLSAEHAEQWLTHVGLEIPPDQVEGDPDTVAVVRRALDEGVASLVDELRRSLDFYGAQESAVPIGRIVLCGAGSAIPGLVPLMEAQLGLPMTVSHPAALAQFGETMAARLTLPYGLALEL